MASDHIRFGPAGNSNSFYAQGHKHSAEAPKWIAGLGLNAYEYSLGRGVRLTEATATAIGAEASQYDIAVSVHAPYYINFCNESAEARAKSRQYIYDSARVAAALGAGRIVFHAGACAGGDRAAALRLALGEIETVLAGLADMGLSGMALCPETMGRPGQLGTVDEVLQMCAVGGGLVPAIDFGHINALEQGSLKTKGDYERIIDSIEAALGREAASQIHVHFSHIQYGPSGEIKHLTLEDDVYGPDFAPLAAVFAERRMKPTVICESRDVMAEDALKLKAAYEAASLGL